MRRALVLVIATGPLFSGHGVVEACGDKLLLLGRGIRFQSRHTPQPARVLLYLPAAAQGPAKLTDPKLESALREAGHKVRAAVGREELDQAVATGQYDVVVADVGEAVSLTDSLGVSTGAPAVLPVVYLLAPEVAAPRLDAAKAKKSHLVVLRVPGRAGHYCAAVDDAMKLKLRRDRSQKTSR